MRRAWVAVLLGCLIFLLAGCGGPAAQPKQLGGAAVKAALALTSTPSSLPEESVATRSQSPPTEGPLPTSTPLPETREPASTDTPPPTSTPTVPPPTPSAVPLALFTIDEVRRISPAEAKALLDSGRAVLYDVRSTAEYQAQHAEGSVSLPGDSVAARFGELPASKSLVFY